MKLRHAAALALVGWYLMLPPRDTTMPEGFNSSAPLNRWLQARAFDSAKACEDGISEFLGYAKAGQSADDKVMQGALIMAQCIATDDPRLKPN
jgi:hypothetical protein